MAQSLARKIPTSPDIEKQLGMQGGMDDESSYARNSSLQAGIIEFALDTFIPALEMLQLPRNGPVRIADLGCSSGPNTISAVSAFVNKLQRRYEAEGLAVPEFQAFFSDLPSNDFNTLFSLLPPYVPSEAVTANDLTKRSYFAAGVQGSFYKRLFPSGSLHAVLTTTALHFLSKVPEAVQNEHSPAWNKGHTWITPSNKQAAQEYAKQAKEDLDKFLSCRAQEMAPGSLLFVMMNGRASPHPEHQFPFVDTDNKDFLHEWLVEIDNCFNDLIREGVIVEEVRDSFNIPLYNRNLEEFEEAVKDSSVFAIHSIQLLKMNVMDFREKDEGGSREGKKKTMGWYSYARSSLGPLIEAHIGCSIAQVFFQRLQARAAECVGRVDKACSYAIIGASLIRKET